MVYIVLTYVIIYSTENVTEDNYLRMTQKRWELGGSVWKKLTKLEIKRKIRSMKNLQ